MSAAHLPRRDGAYRITEVTVAVKSYSREWRRDMRRDHVAQTCRRWPRRWDGEGCTHESEVRPTNSRDNTQDALANVYLMLDPQLRPIAPDMSCEESVKIFEQHKQMAQDYLKVETEIALLSRYMDQLADKLSEEEGLHQFTQQELENYECEIRKLETEKGSLLKLHRNLKRQLEIIKGQHSAQQEGWMSASPKGNKQ